MMVSGWRGGRRGRVAAEEEVVEEEEEDNNEDALNGDKRARETVEEEISRGAVEAVEEVAAVIFQ